MSRVRQQSVRGIAVEALTHFGQTARMTRRALFPALQWLSLTLSVGSLIAPLAAWAAPESYHYDPVHSQILFSIDHDGFSRPFGRLHMARSWIST
jgi:polyisoprenoid-binding protein YceI